MNRIRLEASTAALPVRERAEMEIIPRTSGRSFCGRVVRLGGIRPCGVTRAPRLGPRGFSTRSSSASRPRSLRSPFRNSDVPSSRLSRAEYYTIPLARHVLWRVHPELRFVEGYSESQNDITYAKAHEPPSVLLFRAFLGGLDAAPSMWAHWHCISEVREDTTPAGSHTSYIGLRTSHRNRTQSANQICEFLCYKVQTKITAESNRHRYPSPGTIGDLRTRIA